MKKIISVLICALTVLSSVTLSSVTFFVPAHAVEVLPADTVAVDLTLGGEAGSSAEIKVGEKTYSVVVGETGFSTIGAALAKVPAGGRVLLAAGKYTESVTITKDVTILGPKAGINPNIPGANKTDDWTLNPQRGEGEAIIASNWHMGIYAPDKTVYDCHKITIDGVTVESGGMFRSNYGGKGYIELNYKNIYVRNYVTTNNNGPFYCFSYYPDQKTNHYYREVNAENIRFEGLKTAQGFNLTVDKFYASGLYFDSASNGKCFAFLTTCSAEDSSGEVSYVIKDSMFRQKTNQVINANLKSTSSGTLNQDISKKARVTVQISGNVFLNNDTGVATNNNIIVPQINTENVYFEITNNIFVQQGTVSPNFIAIHGATASLPLGEKFTVTGNRFINIPTALSIGSSTTEFDLSGNYFGDAEGKNPMKPVVVGPDKTSWWYLDPEMTKTSESAGDLIDATFANGTVDEQNRTLTDTTGASEYTFSIQTDAFNTITVYADADLKFSLPNTVTLYKEVSTFYVKITSANGKVSKVYQATITTTNPDQLTYDLTEEVRFFGRTYNDSGVYYFNWSSSGFTFSFKGTGAKATFVSNAPGGSHTAYIKIYVDGVEMPDVALTSAKETLTLASGLDPNVVHTIKVVKRTNARSSSAGVTSVVLLDGEKTEPVKASEKLIEFIGDSLTVGYATVIGNATAWSTATEDSTKTYSEQIAKYFGADYMVTAISGRGIVRNTGGDTDKLFPAIYPYLDEYNLPGVPYDFAVQPDVIVINLGTNDASGNNANLTSTEFRAGLKQFLLDVRNYNPNAEIIYAYGLTTTKFSSDIKAVIEGLNADGDSHISFLALKTCSSSEIVIGHTKAEAYALRGEQIIDLIQKKTGWTKSQDAGSDSETTGESDVDSETDSATLPSTEPESTGNSSGEETDTEKGCRSVLSGGVGIGLTLSGLAFAIRKRKKETD